MELVVVEIQTVLHAKHLGISIIIFNLRNSGGSLFLANKPKGEENMFTQNS
jgi:hypothetical protein